MLIRRAEAKDIPDIHRLLGQVEMVHHVGRPDLFKYKAVKYNNEELAELIQDDSRPIFVGVDEEEKVLGYAFCIFQQYLDNNVMTDIKTLYIDDLCVAYAQRSTSFIIRKWPQVVGHVASIVLCRLQLIFYSPLLALTIGRRRTFSA